MALTAAGGQTGRREAGTAICAPGGYKYAQSFLLFIAEVIYGAVYSQKNSASILPFATGSCIISPKPEGGGLYVRNQLPGVLLPDLCQRAPYKLYG